MKLTPDCKVIIQGIHEAAARFHTPLMQRYGTQIVAGISPGEGGAVEAGVPVFDLVEEAIAAVGPIDTTVVFAPAFQAVDAALEAIAAGIRQVVLTSDGVPPLDMVNLVRKAEATETLVVGPNCPGIIVPGQVLLGMHPPEMYQPGKVGIVSRSSTLTYEVARSLTAAGLGQSIAVCVGPDQIVGSSLLQWLQILDEDEATEVIVLIGEVGSDSELMAARYIAEAIDKPVVVYVAGQFAPKRREIGHADEILAARLVGDRSAGQVPMESIQAAFRKAKARWCDRPSKIPDAVKRLLR
ncbi:MAG: CoA-binding protein [Cyanobacteria bacterium P01_D01_bin.73]